jgi:ABC-type polysaccharide/polyol phosphate export permease
MAGVSRTPFLRSLAIQRNVIGALLMREILTRYGRHNIGFLWVFAEPMFFTLGITALWTFAQLNHVSTLPIVAFALSGYSSVLLWRNMPSRCINAIEPNAALMYHRHVRVLDIYISRLLLECAGATTSFAVLGILFWSIGWLSPPEDLLKVIAGWLLLAWFGGALAIFLGAWSEQHEMVDKIWHPTAYLLFPLSGAATIVDALPPSVQSVVQFFPMVHGIELVREGYFGSIVRAHYDITYMVAWSMALTLAGLAKSRVIGREIVHQ